MLLTLFTEANSSQLSKACIHCVAAADADNCHVLKTATMHSLLMTNARGDLISQLCHQSKIPQTRWLFLPGTHSEQADGKHTWKSGDVMKITERQLLILWTLYKSDNHNSKLNAISKSQINREICVTTNCMFEVNLNFYQKMTKCIWSKRIKRTAYCTRHGVLYWIKQFQELCDFTMSTPKTKNLIEKPVQHPSTNYIRNDNIKEIKTFVGLVDDKDWRQ